MHGFDALEAFFVLAANKAFQPSFSLLQRYGRMTFKLIDWGSTKTKSRKTPVSILFFTQPCASIIAGKRQHLNDSSAHRHHIYPSPIPLWAPRRSSPFSP
jgi:hypothetical protein